MIEMSLLLKTQENIKKDFSVIMRRVTDGVGEITSIIHMKIAPEMDQKLNLMDSNMQDMRRNLEGMINVGMERLFNAIKDNVKDNSINLRDEVFETISATINMNQKFMRELLENLFLNIRKEFKELDRIEECKLSTIDGNIKVIYDTMKDNYKIIFEKIERIDGTC
jgi:hypothetical protein